MPQSRRFFIYRIESRAVKYFTGNCLAVDGLSALVAFASHISRLPVISLLPVCSSIWETASRNFCRNPGEDVSDRQCKCKWRLHARFFTRTFCAKQCRNHKPGCGIIVLRAFDPVPDHIPKKPGQALRTLISVPITGRWH